MKSERVWISDNQDLFDFQTVQISDNFVKCPNLDDFVWISDTVCVWKPNTQMFEFQSSSDFGYLYVLVSVWNPNSWNPNFVSLDFRHPYVSENRNFGTDFRHNLSIKCKI